MTQENLPQDNNVEQTLAMSDEDFLKHFNEQVNQQVAETIEAESKEENTPADSDKSDLNKESDSSNSTVTNESLSTENNTAEAVVETSTTENTVDYKMFFEAVTKPFKANGREIQITDPADIITLMQKGQDYVKKTTELKPIRRIAKLLGDNGLNEEDLAFLIDLKAKKPEAVAKLVKESGIDLYSFDTEQGNEYSPVVPEVAEVNDALQDTLDELQKTSSTFQQTIQIVGNQWDEASRKVFAQHPQMLKVLDAQVASGAFAKIDSIVQYERLMGRLTGVSDLDAYSAVERQLIQQEQSKPPVNKPVPQTATATPATVVNNEQQKLEEQRKRAAPTKAAKPQSQTPLDTTKMSDAEFKQFMASQGIL